MKETAHSLPGSIDYDSLKHLLVKRRRDAHKGNFGHVLVIGGDRGFGGAALMSAEAAARTGTGLVSVATHPSHAMTFLSRRPELMVNGIEYAEDLNNLLPKATVIVIGPGLGQTDWSKLNLRMVLQFLQKNPIPLVIDADALNLISQDLFKDLDLHFSDAILTPHPGEAGRLLQLSTKEVQADRAAAATRLQSLYGGAVILKGAGSLVCYSKGSRQALELCKNGNPGMASGGMGDILSGVLAGLLAQDYSLADAARLATCLHGASGDRAAEEDGERGLLATDLLPWIHKLANPA